MNFHRFVSENPQKIRPLLGLHNRLLGGNRIKVKKGNTLDVRAALLKKTKIAVYGTNNTIFIDDFCTLRGCSFYIAGSNNLVYLSGKSFFIDAEFYIEDDGNEIRVGSGCSVHGKTHLAAIEGTKIIIGDDCMFSSDVHFRTGDSHTITDLDGKRINPSADIVLGSHVWVGTKVICLKGSAVPGHCVIGAGTLLAKPFTGEHAVYAGNPAKLVKTGIDWTRER